MNASVERELPKKGFPARLRQLRAEKSISRAQLGKLVGLHQNHIGRYERGESQPTADKIKKLADALGVSGDYLLDSTTEAAAREQLSDREMLKLFHEVEGLSTEERGVVKSLIKAFVNQKKIREMSAQ